MNNLSSLNKSSTDISTNYFLKFNVQNSYHLTMNPPLYTQNNTVFRNNLYHKPDNKYNRVDPNLVKGKTFDKNIVYVQQQDSNWASKIKP